jgi:Papain family cysteine protease
MEPTAFPQHKKDHILDQLQQKGTSEITIKALRQSGTYDAAAILSLIESFPSLSRAGFVDSPSLSYAVSNMVGGDRFMQMKSDLSADKEMEKTVTHSLGAVPSIDFPWKIGDEMPLMDNSNAPEATTKSTSNIDTRACMPWPVRDQGQRGTCVAFSVTALAEQLCCLNGHPTDLSEQFLYWAIKTHGNDGIPHQDGTWIENALKVLPSHGIPEESYWPYSKEPIPNNISHGGIGQPSAIALANALSRRISSAVYNGSPNRAASSVIEILNQGHAVAVSLPVFEDPISKITNWNTPVAIGLGVVIDPPPTSVMSGGHAVCVTGFVSDPNEPTGGYFIIRNSWSVNWGHRLPAAGAYGPEPGYGQLSATYVDRFLMEYGALQMVQAPS